jgi:hypothetical protein
MAFRRLWNPVYGPHPNDTDSFGAPIFTVEFASKKEYPAGIAAELLSLSPGFGEFVYEE